jgi:Flp pilus assembly protein TadB
MPIVISRRWRTYSTNETELSYLLRESGHHGLVLSFILLLVLVWVILGIIGAVVHGLIWLTIIAAVLFLATMIFGGSRLRGGKVHR